MSAKEVPFSPFGPRQSSVTSNTPQDSTSDRRGSLLRTRSAYETLATPGNTSLDASDPYATKTIYDFQILDCFHELYDLGQHKGSVVLICNVASKCKEYTLSGYTTLTKLYRKHRSEGFVVLAFPCNDFGNREPGNEDEIAENIACAYPSIGEVEFPIMAKVEVNGSHESPLFGFLKNRIRGTLGQSVIRWNFTYFLIDQKGVPYARFAPDASLKEIDARIVELLHPNSSVVPMGTLQSAESVEASNATGGPEGAGKSVTTAADGLSALEHADCSSPPAPHLNNLFLSVAVPVTVISTSATSDDSAMRSDHKVFPYFNGTQESSSLLFNATTATREGEAYERAPASESDEAAR